MPKLKRPMRYMFALWALCLAAGAGTAWMALQQPWMGVRLATSGVDVVVAVIDPATIPEIRAGVRVVQIIGKSGERLAVKPMDLIEEPDFFDTYTEMREFFARQSRLDAILRSGEVTLQWQDDEGQTGEARIVPHPRPLRDLPAVFWFQIAAGFAGLLISCWVYLLRPQDWGARMFALTGLAFPLATSTAAIYSSRELALPGELFQQLSTLNHLGSSLFGSALVALFMCYPRILVHARTLLLLPAFFGMWYLADALQWAPNMDWGIRIPLIVELLLAITFAVVQWRKSRGQPLERAALRWFTLSTLLGCSLFILAVPGQSALGLITPISQGYSFGFFLIMYAGIALGLRKYRLFDLDEWAYRILLWIAGASSILAMDALLIYVGMEASTSLGLSLFACGWLYFPFRQWLWQRIVSSKSAARFETLLPHVSEIAFVASADERESRWDVLIKQMFDPLEMARGEMARSDTDNTHAVIGENGLALTIPACAGLQGRTLRYAARGGRLFTSYDAAAAESLRRLTEQVMSGREGYERGVEQERRRLARDLHDNIGARLLKLIHHLRGSPNAEIARDAMKDLRSAISAIDAPPAPLHEALADWRAEIDSRCEAANVRLDWSQQTTLPEINLQPRIKAALGSALREAITNALKHAATTSLKVQVSVQNDGLTLNVENDGLNNHPAQWQEGYGLRSIRGRLHDLDGKLEINAIDGVALLAMFIPLKALT